MPTEISTTCNIEVKVHPLPPGLPEAVEFEAIHRMHWAIGACALAHQKLGLLEAGPGGHLEVRCIPVDYDGYGPDARHLTEGSANYMVLCYWQEDGTGWIPIARHPLGGYYFYI